MKNKKENKLNKKQKSYIMIAIIFAIIIGLVIVCAIIKKNNGSILNPDGNETINEKFSFLVESESSEIEANDIVGAQKVITEEIEAEYKKGNYTIANPYVKENPYVISPQTALVMFKTKKAMTVKVTIKGKHDDDLVLNFESSKEHVLPIYGLYANYDNQVIVETEDGKSNTITIRPTYSESVNKVEVLTNEVQNSNGEFYFATSSLGVANAAYDNYGEIRWFIDMGYTKGMTMLQNGNLLISNSKSGPDITSTAGVVEIDMLGHVTREYEIEGGYHHDAYELASGNILVLTSDVNADTVADLIVELDRKTGKVVHTWDFAKIVKEIDDSIIDENEITWGWLNSITFDSSTNSIVVSARNRNSVVSIDYETGNINWILGQEKYWSNKFSQYLIKGVGSDFIYPAGQHSLTMNNGKLQMFNNGYDSYREGEKSCKTLKNNESYAMIYNIDASNKTATIDYKFGGHEYFSYALSSYTNSTNGHKIFNSGWHFPDESIYDQENCTQFNNALYDSYIIDFDENNNVSVKLRIEESKFEVIKAPIYNLAAVSVNPTTVTEYSNYKFSEGEYVSAKEPEKYEILSEEDALSYADHYDEFLTFEYFDKKLYLSGVFLDFEEVDIILISPKGTAYKYVYKEPYKDQKQYLDISLLPKGRYYVYVKTTGEVFNSTEYLIIK